MKSKISEPHQITQEQRTIFCVYLVHIIDLPVFVELDKPASWWANLSFFMFDVILRLLGMIIIFFTSG